MDDFEKSREDIREREKTGALIGEYLSNTKETFSSKVGILVNVKGNTLQKQVHVYSFISVLHKYGIYIGEESDLLLDHIIRMFPSASVLDQAFVNSAYFYHIMNYGKKENILILFSLCKDYKDLIKICSYDSVQHVLFHATTSNLQVLQKLSPSIDDFVLLSKNEGIRKLLFFCLPEKFSLLLEVFHIQNIGELNALCMHYTVIVEMFIAGEKDILTFICDQFKLTKEEWNSIAQRMDVKNMIMQVDFVSFQKFLSFYEISTKEEFVYFLRHYSHFDLVSQIDSIFWEISHTFFVSGKQLAKSPYERSILHLLLSFQRYSKEVFVLFLKMFSGIEDLQKVAYEGEKHNFFSKVVQLGDVTWRMLFTSYIKNSEDFLFFLSKERLVTFFSLISPGIYQVLKELYVLSTLEEVEQCIEEKNEIIDLCMHFSYDAVLWIFRFCKGDRKLFEMFLLESKKYLFLTRLNENHLWCIQKLYFVESVEDFFYHISNTRVKDFFTNIYTFHDFGVWRFLLMLGENSLDMRKHVLRFFEKKVFSNKYDARFLFQSESIHYDYFFFNILSTHFLTYRQKSFLDFLKNIYVLSGMGIKMNIQQFKTLDDYKENDRIDEKRLMGDVARILEFLQRNNKEKILQNLERALRTKDEKSALRICMDVVLEYVEVYLERKLYIHIVSHLKKEAKSMGIAWEDIEKEELWKKMKRKEFIEAYKIVQAPIYNRYQGIVLLLKYLRGEFERVEECRQYDTAKNRRWMHRYLKGNEKELWLSRMRKEYEVEVEGTRKKVIIEKELDPLKIMMMGNRVDGSCLSYYSDKGYYYSVISSAVDVNKGVFYIYDENGKILGRFVVSIGDDKRMSRYPIYYARKIEGVDFDAVVNTYVKEIARELNMQLNGEPICVSHIESEQWYCDLPVEVE